MVAPRGWLRCHPHAERRGWFGAWSGPRWDLDHAPVLVGEVPEVDGRGFQPDRGERRADLAPMVGAVVEGLREPDAYGGMSLRPVVAPPHRDGVGVQLLRQ